MKIKILTVVLGLLLVGSIVCNLSAYKNNQALNSQLASLHIELAASNEKLESLTKDYKKGQQELADIQEKTEKIKQEKEVDIELDMEDDNGDGIPNSFQVKYDKMTEEQKELFSNGLTAVINNLDDPNADHEYEYKKNEDGTSVMIDKTTGRVYHSGDVNGIGFTLTGEVFENIYIGTDKDIRDLEKRQEERMKDEKAGF